MFSETSRQSITKYQYIKISAFCEGELVLKDPSSSSSDSQSEQQAHLKVLVQHWYEKIMSYVSRSTVSSSCLISVCDPCLSFFTLPFACCISHLLPATWAWLLCPSSCNSATTKCRCGFHVLQRMSCNHFDPLTIHLINSSVWFMTCKTKCLHR